MRILFIITVRWLNDETDESRRVHVVCVDTSLRSGVFRRDVVSAAGGDGAVAGGADADGEGTIVRTARA